MPRITHITAEVFMPRLLEREVQAAKNIKFEYFRAEKRRIAKDERRRRNYEDFGERALQHDEFPRRSIYDAILSRHQCYHTRLFIHNNATRALVCTRPFHFISSIIIICQEDGFLPM